MYSLLKLINYVHLKACKKYKHFLTTLKALAGAGNELVSSKYFSQEKCLACG